MRKHHDSAAVAGRVRMGVLFFMSGLSKLAAPVATQGSIGSAGLPAPALAFAAAAAVEIIGGSLLAANVWNRLVTARITFFTLATALSFRGIFADQYQMIHLMMNIAIVGGLIQVLAFGGDGFSIDGLLGRRSAHPAALTPRPAQ